MNEQIQELIKQLRAYTIKREARNSNDNTQSISFLPTPAQDGIMYIYATQKAKGYGIAIALTANLIYNDGSDSIDLVYSTLQLHNDDVQSLFDKNQADRIGVTDINQATCYDKLNPNTQSAIATLQSFIEQQTELVFKEMALA